MQSPSNSLRDAHVQRSYCCLRYMDSCDDWYHISHAWENRGHHLHPYLDTEPGIPFAEARHAFPTDCPWCHHWRSCISWMGFDNGRPQRPELSHSVICGNYELGFIL